MQEIFIFDFITDRIINFLDITICSWYYFTVLLHKLCVRATLCVRVVAMAWLWENTCVEVWNKSWSFLSTGGDFTSFLEHTTTHVQLHHTLYHFVGINQWFTLNATLACWRKKIFTDLFSLLCHGDNKWHNYNLFQSFKFLSSVISAFFHWLFLFRSIMKLWSISVYYRTTIIIV